MPPNGIHRKTHTTYVIFLPKMFKLNLVIRKQVDKSKLRDIMANTLHRRSVGHLRRLERALKYGLVSFYCLGNFMGYWAEGLFQLFGGRDRDFQELGHHPHFYLLWSVPELSWVNWWVCHLDAANVQQWVYNEAQGPLEVKSSTILDPLILTSVCHVLWLCHFLKGSWEGVLPPSLLFY